jgi:NhaP-type Na+/H+ or K+/H+ antiporter
LGIEENLMHADIGITPALTVALALAAGVIAQSTARHLRIPGIVLLLGAGVILGPDGLGVLRPDDLGGALSILVEFAVAVILFQGGLSLNWKRLRREATTIRLLVSVGAVVTAVGGAIASRSILGWSWPLSILFGALVIVTGPTVITPLLRRIKLEHRLETILEAEGVFIDAVGAILAVVVLEVVLSPSRSSVALGLAGVPTRLVFGALFGLGGGVLIALMLRFRGLVPEGYENVFALTLALALFQTSNAIVAETGIVSVIVAGLVVGNRPMPVVSELREFKEQLTVMFIGMLFVLLAADVRLAQVGVLGWTGVAVVLALMFIVRPVDVFVCTWGSGLSLKRKAFLSWLAPRGIVAAAIASLFYERMTALGMNGGAELRALVFMVIAVTVVVQGTTGGIVARWLGVRRPMGQGYVILGAQPIGRLLGGLLRDAGEEVVFIDASAKPAEDAESDGFRVVFGNALEERILLRADVESRHAVVGALHNEAVNLLFARKARNEYKVPNVFVALQRGQPSVDPKMVDEAGGAVLFGDETDLELWSVRIRREIAKVEAWRMGGKRETPEGGGEQRAQLPKGMHNTLLPLAVREDETIRLMTNRTKIRGGDSVFWLVFAERRDDAVRWLGDHGWEPESEAHAVDPTS